MRKALTRRLILPLLVLALLVGFTGIASAESTGPTTEDLATAINVMWMLVAGFLIFFMRPALPWWRPASPAPKTWPTR